ncbi:hypothetical protein SynBIOSE41_02923 [Synechococcus sp. BIOS-E4-1]|nr:hypothetical protein MITS9504_02403 [Synechococcus sp. MIT S9504]KZR91269.1 hypothetical protein MITS9509_02497 [Synechococcus sp. MIT S9509]QNI55410.1 hypothetical protein SynBIOSE41_02923 [Synechococcus sp. BIOS-E4-1]
MSSEVLENLLKKDIHEDTWEWWKSHLYFLRQDQDFYEAEAVFKEFSMYKSRPCEFDS